MNETDPDITFDDAGICNHCRNYDKRISSPAYLETQEEGAFDRLIAKIKSEGKNKEYDCIIGVSGGVDSTYVAYILKKAGLRPLAIHFDNGWNSELAVHNITNTIKALGIDLFTYVVDWEEFRDLQMAFLRSSTPDIEIPSDHAIMAILYKEAAKHNIKYVISGINTATEAGGVAAWSRGHNDWKYIKSINKLFGGRRLKTYPHLGFFQFVRLKILKSISIIPILDYIKYEKSAALSVMEKELGYRPYSNKHFESIFTRFYQGYILPNKFGFDKKRMHLSALIWSGQITRTDALKLMDEVDYDEAQVKEDTDFFMKKFQLDQKGFDALMSAKPKTIFDYPSYTAMFKKLNFLKRTYHYFKLK